jgi:hypothetical protein
MAQIQRAASAIRASSTNKIQPERCREEVETGWGVVVGMVDELGSGHDPCVGPAFHTWRRCTRARDGSGNPTDAGGRGVIPLSTTSRAAKCDGRRCTSENRDCGLTGGFGREPRFPMFALSRRWKNPCGSGRVLLCGVNSQAVVGEERPCGEVAERY